jgi:hypothetical protein
MTYLFTSFRGNGEDGLHLAWSEDGYTWTDLGRSFLAPKVGVSKLMRDPSLLLASDGTFHMVWTSGWTEKGIGYASSCDLVNWSEQQYFEVMAHEPTTMNTWAPELTYDADSGEYLIYWSSTIPTRYPGDDGHQKGYNHRQYFATTRDFKTLSPTRLFYEPGHSIIDGVLVRRGPKDWVFIYKDERRDKLHMRAAFASSPRGPFTSPTEPFTAHRTEGPSVLKIGEDWFIYFDIYGSGQYGAVKTKDFKTFTDITAQVSFPKGHRHGTGLTVPRAIMERLMSHNSQ